MELRAIDDQVHNERLTGSRSEHFMQHSLWGDVKSKFGWEKIVLGLFDGDKEDTLKGSVLLLKQKLPKIKRYHYYAPRGFVIDYEDTKLMKEFVKLLRYYVKQNRGISLTVDPDFPALAHNENGRIQVDAFVENMESLGFRHGGYNMNFEKVQPRFSFRLGLKDGEDAVYNRFDRFCKKAIQQSADNGIRVYKSDDIETLHEIMRETALRDKIIEYNLDYYRSVYETLVPAGMCDIWFAEYDPGRHLEAIGGLMRLADDEIAACEARIASKDTAKARTALLQATQKRERLDGLAETAKDYVKRYPNGIVLSCGLNINTANRGWTVFGGSRAVLREMNANYAITWAAIQEYCERGIEWVDFFGTTGEPGEENPLNGIHRFKKGFSGEFIEFPGEFSLVVSRFWNWAWNRVYKKLVWWYQGWVIRRRQRQK